MVEHDPNVSLDNDSQSSTNRVMTVYENHNNEANTSNCDTYKNYANTNVNESSKENSSNLDMYKNYANTNVNESSNGWGQTNQWLTERESLLQRERENLLQRLKDKEFECERLQHAYAMKQNTMTSQRDNGDTVDDGDTM